MSLHLSQNIEEWIYVMSLHVSQNHLTIFSVKLAGEQNLLKGSKKWLLFIPQTESNVTPGKMARQ